jgi:glutamyl-tRNA synthetase
LRKRWKPAAAAAIETFIRRIGELEHFTPGEVERIFTSVLEGAGMKIGQVMPSYRLFVAGRMQGPGMFDVSAFLGRDEVSARLRKGLDICAAWA